MKNVVYPLVLVCMCLMFACTPGAVVVHENTYQPPPRPAQSAPPPVYTAPPAEAQPQPEATYQVFYDELTPYGRWIDYPGYGYVWSPNADPDFQPYSTNGHWVYSDEGWTWVSTYSWGWAPFHYGRWFYEDGYGWLWLPGKEWAPAWVTWGQSGTYLGWAPLAPKVEVSVRYTPPPHEWTFVPQEHITKVNVHDYVVNKTTNVTIVKNVTIINNINNNNSTTVINNRNVTNNTTNNTNITNNNVHKNVVYNRGPQINVVEKATNSHVQVVNIDEHKKPAATVVNNNKVTFYRPVIKEKVQVQKKPAPRSAETYKPRPSNRPANN